MIQVAAPSLERDDSYHLLRHPQLRDDGRTAPSRSAASATAFFASTSV